MFRTELLPNAIRKVAVPKGSPFLVILVLLCVGYASLAAHAAQTVGSIEGQVTDNTGGVLPGVTVLITSEETGIARTLVTDAQGEYRARELGLGQYRVEASLSGFQSVVRRGITLTLGREAVVDLVLPISGLAEAVVVTGDAPLVQTRSGEVTAFVSRDPLEDLPLNSRDYTQLIAIQAGTMFYRAQEGNRQSGYGNRISVSGARPTSNAFTLDGSEIQTTHGQLPTGVTGAQLGLESVQEFRVLTSNYSAQHGRAAGATIVAATRSGTNTLRGTTYWYHRNDSLDAKNFFDPEKPEFLRNQFGASLGGRIVRNQTFFFVNLEGLRQDVPQRLFGRVPTAAARQGILPTRIVAVDPAVQPYLALYPLPTGEDFGDGTAEFFRAENQPTSQDYVTARVDHQFNTRHSIFGRYTMDQSDTVEPQLFGFYESERWTRMQYGTVELKSLLSPRLVNQLRVGYTRSNIQNGRSPLDPPDDTLAVYPGRPFPSISISGVSGLGIGESARQDRIISPQLHNDVSYDIGRHSLRVGGALTLMKIPKVQFSREGGDWTRGSFQEFLQNDPPDRLRIMGFEADPERTFEQTMVAFYAQDDIRMGNVTLNAGIRAEYLTTPTEEQGRIANVRNLTDAAPTVGEPYYENPGMFFAPRLGLAWDPTGSGKMSVRSGFGIFHEPLLVRYYLNSMDRQPPFWSDVDPHPRELGGLFPDLGPHLQRLSEGGQAVHVFEFRPDNPYTMQWNLSLQRTLGEQIVAEAGYVGSRGKNVAGRKALAVPTPTFIDGETFYAPGAELFNPNFTRLELYDTSASSAYHSLRLTVSKRQSASGLHFQAGYTWSKSMDTQSASLGGELGSSTLMNPFDPMQDWGLSDFHVAHSLNANAGYLLPWGADLQGLAGALVQGWQVTGVLSMHTGTPFSVQSHGRLTHPLNRGSSRPDLAPGGDNNPILGGVDQYFDPLQFQPQRRGFYGTVGRNTLIGPGLINVDAAVVKRQSLGGSRHLQFRFEVFNLLNRANFDLPSSTLFNSRGVRNANAGRITSTVTTARQIQLALRFEF